MPIHFMLSGTSPTSSKEIQTSVRIRHPPYTYLHLTLLSASKFTDPPGPAASKELPDIDDLTACSYLSAALQQYLGLTGAAIPMDVLKTNGRDCWIRVPREDGMAVAGALGQWATHKGGGGVAWRIKNQGNWLGNVAAGNGEALFAPGEQDCAPTLNIM